MFCLCGLDRCLEDVFVVWRMCLNMICQNFTGISSEFHRSIESEHLEEGDSHSSAFPHPRESYL